MASINNYRFGSYAILAMGLINLRYQTGAGENLSKSSVLILVGAVALLLTFIPQLSENSVELIPVREISTRI